jgi:GT2 family glycosyltransferase
MKNISFVTNCSVNTRDHVELLLKSLKTNLDNKNHEIIVFIDSDNEGIREYLRTIKHEFVDLKVVTHKINPCTGYALNNNILVDLAKYDIVSYLQSDMVIGPHYDTYIFNELKENMILSSTRVEPPLHGYSNYTITYDFGTDPLEFDMEKWNAYSAIVKTSKEAEYFFAPITFYKKVWQSIGGYDTIFRRSREDSDFVQRAVQSGIRLIQTWQANVYHFTCVSSRGKNWFDENNKQAQKKLEIQKIADGIEIRRFLKKWGRFNHGEQKLKKLDIDLVIKDSRDLNPLFVSQLEVYSSRVWVKSEDNLNLIIQIFNNEQDPANELLGYTKENWEEVKHLFRTTDFSSIYKVGEPTEFNIKIEVDFTNIDPNEDQFLRNITHLSDILEGYEPGMYELGSAKIEIRNIVDVTQDQIVVINPSFDYSLLTIE